MLRSRRVPVCTVIVLCTAVLAFAAKIKADFDKTADFLSYKTYAWGQCLEPTRAGAKIVISSAIDYELDARGLKHQDVEQADLIVRYEAAGDSDLNFSAAPDPTYAFVGGVPLPGTTVWTSGLNQPSSGRFVRKGTLVIDVFDRRQQKLVWSASATDTIHESSSKAIKQIGDIVSSMFAQYPLKART